MGDTKPRLVFCVDPPPLNIAPTPIPPEEIARMYGIPIRFLDGLNLDTGRRG